MAVQPAFARFLIDTVRSAPDEVVLELVVHYLRHLETLAAPGPATGSAGAAALFSGASSPPGASPAVARAPRPEPTGETSEIPRSNPLPSPFTPAGVTTVVDPQAITAAQRPSRDRVTRESDRRETREGAVMPVRRRRTSQADRAADKARVLEHVRRLDAGVSRGAVAEILDLPPPAVGQILRALVEEGHIFRAGERRLARYGRTQELADRATQGDDEPT
ncbi:MAG: hypothetical protein AAF715_23570 [Myxococcota bacterium]